MKNDPAPKAYGSDIKAFIATHMDFALERMVQLGLFAKRSGFQQDLISEVFVEKTAPLVRGILRSIDPEVSRNIQEMDERQICRIYWALRSGPTNPRMSIFELLGELNDNSPCAPVFA